MTSDTLEYPPVTNVQIPESAETIERKYQSMIRAVAAGRRGELDPKLTAASRRFEIDAAKDLAVACKRVKYVALVADSDAKLAELEQNLPAARPTADTLLSSLTTLADLLNAIGAVQHPHHATLDQKIWSDAKNDARTERQKAISWLRFSADESIDLQGTANQNRTADST